MNAKAETVATRGVTRLVRGMATSDGAGVKLTRVIGQPQLQDLDPFLMLDEFGTENPGDYIGGFPSHPHRGFETVTYMLEGAFEHHDSSGGGGYLGPGDVQWMTAGAGILHPQLPAGRNRRALHSQQQEDRPQQVGKLGGEKESSQRGFGRDFFGRQSHRHVTDEHARHP